MKKLMVLVSLISVIFAASNKSFAYDFRMTSDNIPWANEYNVLAVYNSLQIPIQKATDNKLARISLDIALALPLSVIGHEFGGHANACPTAASVKIGFFGLSGETTCDFNPTGMTYNNDGTANVIYPNSAVQKWYENGNTPTLVYEAGINFQTSLAELATRESMKKNRLPIETSIIRILNASELFKYILETGDPQSNGFGEKTDNGYDPADYIASISQNPDQESSLYANMMALGLWQIAGLIPDAANFISYLSGKEMKMPDYWLEPLGLLTPYGAEYQLAFFANNPNIEIKAGLGKSFVSGVSNLMMISIEANDVKITNRIKISPYIEAYKNLGYGFVGGSKIAFEISRKVGVGIGMEIKPTKGFSPKFQFVNPCARSYVDLTMNF